MILSALPGCHRRNLPLHPGEVWDAGAIFSSSTPTLTHRFLVKNSTGRTVHILSEDHSCDCTTVDLPKRELAPGESVALTMSVRVPPAYAKRNVGTTLKTDDPDHPNWVYHVGFEAFPDARIVPQTIQLGSHTVAEMLKPESEADVVGSEAWLEVFTPSNGQNRPLAKLGQVPTECNVTMAQTPEVRILANRIRLERYRLSVRLKKGVSATGTFARLLYASMKDEGGPSASITWSVRAPVNVAPTRIHLGSVAPKAGPIKRSVVLQSVDGTSFRMLAVESGPCCKAIRKGGGEFPSLASDRHDLELVFELSSEGISRFRAGTIRIRTDRQDYSEVLLPWSALLHTGADR